jgi:predicted RNase H-like nuclease (RuvC/YqgF family)
MPVPLTPSTDQLRQWNEKLKQQLQQQQAEEEALAVTDMDLPTAHRRVQQLQQNLAITRKQADSIKQRLQQLEKEKANMVSGAHATGCREACGSGRRTNPVGECRSFQLS